MRSMGEVPHVADCLKDGRGSFPALPFYENLREGKQLGSDPWWSVCCQSEFSLIQQKIRRTPFPIHHRKVSDFSLLSLGEFHILFHSLINFWKSHFVIFKSIILISPGGRGIPAQEDCYLMEITGWNEVEGNSLLLVHSFSAAVWDISGLAPWYPDLGCTSFLLRKMPPMVHNKNFVSFNL